MNNNAFFKHTDPAYHLLDNYAMPPVLWIHPWMYHFGLSFVKHGMVAADLGTGWHYRPFRYALARVCEHVYAVDSCRALLDEKRAQRLQFVIADFTSTIDEIEPGSLDIAYFMHSLEENTLPLGLYEAAKLLKPSGRVIICADHRFDDAKPLGRWKGLTIASITRAAGGAGLMFDGDIDADKTGAVVHEEFNLCNFHCVLRREQ
jgi:SAM-dependent methyltransferase